MLNLTGKLERFGRLHGSCCLAGNARSMFGISLDKSAQQSERKRRDIKRQARLVGLDFLHPFFKATVDRSI